MNDVSLAIAISNGGGHAGHAHRGERCGGPREVHHHHHHGSGCDDDKGPQPPKRNGFLDFLSAPLQAIGKGGNQNDKQYDKYLQAHHAGNALKG
jgi:hypothetical protein